MRIRSSGSTNFVVPDSKKCAGDRAFSVIAPAGVSILQENLNYSPALNVVCQILPQIHPQLSKLQVPSNRGHRSIFLTFFSC